MEANVESLRNLSENLKLQALDLKTIPYVLQLNKRDVPGAIPVDVMLKALRVKGEEYIEAIAPRGVGVFETLKAVARHVLISLKKTA